MEKRGSKWQVSDGSSSRYRKGTYTWLLKHSSIHQIPLKLDPFTHTTPSYLPLLVWLLDDVPFGYSGTNYSFTKRSDPWLSWGVVTNLWDMPCGWSGSGTVVPTVHENRRKCWLSRWGSRRRMAIYSWCKLLASGRRLSLNSGIATLVKIGKAATLYLNAD